MVDEPRTMISTRRRRLRAISLVAVIAVLAVQQLAPAPAAAATFTNPTEIFVPERAPDPPPWAANPYPSTITVSGLSGTVADVNLTLNGFDCSATGNDFAYPEDNDILLVGPTGVNVLVLSDVGGANQDSPLQFGPVNVTIDDEAAQPLPADTQLSAGTYRPLDDDDDPPFSFGAVPQDPPGDPFPAPAPQPSGATMLSAFDGTDSNGTWSLYLADDVVGPDTCAIRNGWTLDITTSGGGGGTTTTSTPATTTSTIPATTTTSTPATTTTSTPVTTTTSTPATTTTSTPPTGGPIQIDELVLSNGDVARVTGTINCQAGHRFRMRMVITQDSTEGRAMITGNCTGEPQRFRAVVEVRSGPGFEDGAASARAVAQVGNPDTHTIVDRFSTADEVQLDVVGGMGAAMLSASS